MSSTKTLLTVKEMVQGVGGQCSSDEPEPDSAGCFMNAQGASQVKRGTQSHFGVLRQNLLELLESSLELRQTWG